MKIAICYSGLYRVWDGWRENHNAVLSTIDADIFYTTWKSQNPPSNVLAVDDPTFFYNAYENKQFQLRYGNQAGSKPSEQHRLKISTVQHLAHARACKLLPMRYDVIIRMRYDTTLSTKLPLAKLIEHCSKTGLSIGIGSLQNLDDDPSKLHIVSQKIAFDKSNKQYRMADFMNIHLSSNLRDAERMYHSGEIYPTNAGWAQILSDDGKFENYVGGILLQRTLEN